MRRGFDINQVRRIERRLTGLLLRGRRIEHTAGGGDGGADLGNIEDRPIQDPDGNSYFMCGVSECGGPDVCGP